MAGPEKTVLLLSLPNFDRRYIFHKEMGSGVGFKSLRPPELQTRPRRIYPIAELQYAAAVLREAGHNPVIDDDQYRDSVDPAAYRQALQARCPEPDVIFVRTSLPTLFTDLDLTQNLRSLYPDVPCHVFGPLFAATEVVDFVKQQRVYDGVVASEIESVILEIVEERAPSTVPGFHHLKNGSYACGDPSRRLTDMQALPLPAYDLVDYRKMDRFIVQTSRGCPIGCNYCPYFISQGNKFRAKTPDRALAEFRHIAENFGAQRVIIHDPIFTLDKKRIIGLCENLIEADLGIEWECESHMNHLDPELIALMYRAGLRILAFGVESANEEVLKRAGRRFKNWDRMKENVAAARALGVETRAYFILALPGDTISGAYATIDLAKYIGADLSKFNLPNPYPGTGAYETALSEGWLDREQFETDREAFYRARGLHGHGEPSMTPHMSDLQARYLSRIGNHSVQMESERGFRLSRRSKILAYKAAVHGIDALRQVGVQVG